MLDISPTGLLGRKDDEAGVLLDAAEKMPANAKKDGQAVATCRFRSSAGRAKLVCTMGKPQAQPSALT